uniref:MTSS I-BAR domain containing 1 n=1 Tax=Oreochromis aureus TaxID=47969 RepID=A0A668RBR9_OREAU
METVMERECSALGGLFQTVIGDMKGSYPVWDDFISKASKLQSQLRTTVVAVAAFLDAFQKVADLATNSRGGTRDIGSALTRMCMRHRSIEAKLRQFSMVFLDCLINPLQEQMEEWKRVANTLDKDHAKEYKKARQEIKKRSSDTLKLQKKAKKGLSRVIVDLKGSECTWSYQTPPSSPSTTVSRKSSMCSSLNSVNSSDSRSSGSHCHSPTSHFRYRASSSSSSSVLPQQTPARLSSISSHDSGFISQDAYQSKSPSPMPPETLQLTNGFDHHGAQDTHLHPSYFSYSSPTTTTTTSPISSPSCSSVSPTWPWSRSGCGQSGEFPPLSPSGLGVIPSSRVPSWKDWAKPGPYDQPMVNTLKRSKDRRETTDPSSHQGADVTTPGEEPNRGKGNNTSTSPKVDRETHEELARALARGLQLDIHGSSRDSLQGSSGYSSQTNTPCCSEDTIPSQVSDCDYYTVGADQEVEQQSSDFDKSSTIPRNSDISQSYRRMFQSKRPASTAGLPSNPSAVITPGVATIRRTPSSKPNLRRPSGGLNLGPIPIKPPMIPVKTPTVPEHPGFPSKAASEDGNTPRTPLSPATTPLSPGSNGSLSPKSVPWETQHLGKGSDPPTPPPQPSGRSSEWERRPLPELLEETEYAEVEDFLVAIRRGVKLKKTTTNDRSAPMIH